MNFTIGADLDRFQDHSAENINDFWAGFDGELNVGRSSKFFGGLRHNHEHEDRYVAGTPGPDQQTEPTRYDHEEAHAGFVTSRGPWRLRIGGTYDLYDYQDARSVTGQTLRKHDRRHDITALGARLGYAFSAEYEGFLQYASDWRRYDQSLQGQAFNRDSDGYTAALGLRYNGAGKRLSGEAFVGRMHQEYDYAAFSAVSKPYFGGSVLWHPQPAVTVKGYVDRVLEETIVSNVGDYAASSLDTTYGIQVERQLSRRLSVLAHFAQTYSQFQSFDRNDRVREAGAGVRYYVTPAVFVGGDLRVIDRSSSDLDAEYRRSQLMFSLGYTPARAKNYALRQGYFTPQDPSFAQAAGEGMFAGPYVGAALGYGLLTAQTTDVADNASDQGDMGGSGGAEALFFGYGLEFQRWYLGLEGEVEQSQADWSHSKGKTEARSSSLERDESYALSLRAGRVVDNGSLLYLRLGGVRSAFQSYYGVNDLPAGAYDQGDHLGGWRLGMGADIPAGERMFLRMEYAYTSYDSYRANYLSHSGSAITTFEPEETQFRLGMGWRLGGKASAAPRRPAVNGFYAGAHLGHGGVDSRLSGLHSETGVPPLSQPFNGDFAGLDGVYGAFAGYGLNLGRWYLGVEAELDTSDINWNHFRQTGGGPGGRDFSVEKKSDYGLALRAGYTLDNGTLIYGRVGPVRGRFNTTWSKGGNSSAAIDRSDVVDGFRYGLGAEIPLSQGTFLRVDYTRTDYKSYGFLTEQANPDEMSFDNKESLFRVGFGFRF